MKTTNIPKNMPKRISNLLSSFHGFDWWLTAAVFLLSLFGLAAIYSIGLGRPDSHFLDFKKQIIFLIVGLGLMILSSRFSYTFYRAVSRSFYAFCLLLLLGVLFWGTAIRGTKGWFAWGGLSFQPVELMKVGLILLLAFFASRRARSFSTLNFFAGSAFYASLSVILVILQPDFGSSFLLILVWFSLILISGTKKKYLIILLLVLCSLFLAAWLFFFKDYQKERFLTFLDPSRDLLGRGYNITQSIIAVGSGEFWGRGLGFGSQSQLRFLPETQTDFIFAVVAEEMGFVGASLIITLFALLFWRLIKLAQTSRDDFALFTTLGILAVFFWQFLINISMNIGLLPIAGLTLPFMSAGGSSLIVNFLLIGLAQSLARSGTMRRE